MAKATLCHAFFTAPDNDSHMKRNARDYCKKRKDKASNSRKATRMNGIIHQLTSTGTPLKDLNPMMNFAQALQDDTDSMATPVIPHLHQASDSHRRW